MSEARLYTREEIERRLDEIVVEIRRELSAKRRAPRPPQTPPRQATS